MIGWGRAASSVTVTTSLASTTLPCGIHCQVGVEDLAVWKPNENGVFSCSSAWNICRKKRMVIPSRLIWHTRIPFKISFCYGATETGNDEINHIFVNGNFANYIWKYFYALVGSNMIKYI
ncbi:hypothetical protein H5410_027323 [Solanum commersonii]|uniref:Uncharacterized protein n=1 Tax=Solanum commersonii TaxID=4109 RepID=A0A9J5Z1N7_SOLCO|nr:hypothetical protein H5410_027323 [Solanum commersonii]